MYPVMPYTVLQSSDHNDRLTCMQLIVWHHAPKHFPAYDTGDTVTTWTGEILGHVTARRKIWHNFAGHMEYIAVHGTNGEYYSGRHSHNHQYVNLVRIDS